MEFFYRHLDATETWTSISLVHADAIKTEKSKKQDYKNYASVTQFGLQFDM